MFKSRLGFGGITFNIINTLILFAFTFICIYPFYYIIISSLSSPGAISRGVYLWPEDFSIESYRRILVTPGISRSAFISLARTALGTFIAVACSTFVGYIFSYQEIPFRKFIYRFMIITMYLNAGLIPYYLTMRMYGFNNNFLVYIVPGALSAYFVVLVKTFIEQLPASLEEAAIIDGAGILTIFNRVIFPLSRPIIATIGVFAAVGQWNSWFDNLIFMVGRPDLNTLQIMLYNILNKAASISNQIDTNTAEQLAKRITPDSIRTTTTMIVTFPILFAYPFAQRYFVKGIMIGAIKG